MKWFKHDSNANMDSKLQEILLDYGLEGYGLYFYCLELVASNVEKHNLTFELEHDARIIARNTGSTVEKVQQMMGRFIELNLFENADGVITCLKMLTRADEYTSKLIRDYKANGNNGLSPPPSNSLESPDSLGIKSELREEKRREEKRKEEKRNSKAKTARFKKPSLNEVKAVVSENKYTFSPDNFFNFYESKNWMVGKSKMKSWKHAAANWQSREPKKQSKEVW